jgi:hypothetical protein
MLAPLTVAALVLCVAGGAKLRDPDSAVAALRTVGLPATSLAIRMFAVSELVLGAAASIAPTTITAAAIACVYTVFAALALALSRRRAPCGCFGTSGTEASRGQAAISAVLALACGAAAIDPPHGLLWIAGRPALEIAVLGAGIAGAVFGTVVTYIELPSAWTSWSRR